MAEVARPKSGIILPLVKLLIFTLVAPCSVTLWVPYYFYFSRYDWASLRFTARTADGALLIVAGAAGSLWCALDFAFRGRGTPAPIDPPKVLVVCGLYRYVRNPMYVSVLLVLLGECLLIGSVPMLGYAGVVAAGFHLFVLGVEEPILRRKFGSAYDDYCAGVWRWIPRMPGKDESHEV